MTEYQDFSDALLADLAPVGIDEQQLALHIVDLYWRLERASILEANLLSLAHQEPAPDYLINIEDPAVSLAMLQTNAFLKHYKQLSKIQLQEERISRSLLAATKRFAALQKLRLTRASGKIGFVSENTLLPNSGSCQASKTSKNAAAA